MANKRLTGFYGREKRTYEICAILEQTLTPEAVKTKLDELEEILKTVFAAEVKFSTCTGLKAYCYPIKNSNNKKGYYILIHAELKPTDIAKISKKLSTQSNVLRVLILLSDPKKQSLGIFSINTEEEGQKGRGEILYNDPNVLNKFLGERGRIEAKKQVLGKKVAHGVAKRQHIISKQIKRARFLSLLPYIEE